MAVGFSEKLGFRLHRSHPVKGKALSSAEVPSAAFREVPETKEEDTHGKKNRNSYL
jgi:hypothetical protein